MAKDFKDQFNTLAENIQITLQTTITCRWLKGLMLMVAVHIIN